MLNLLLIRYYNKKILLNIILEPNMTSKKEIRELVEKCDNRRVP